MFSIFIYTIIVASVIADFFECPILESSSKCSCDSNTFECNATTLDDVRKSMISANAVNRPNHQVLFTLKIKAVSIDNFGREFLGDFPIKHVTVSECGINNIDIDTFDHLSDDLVLLDLSNNDLLEVPTTALEKLSNLQVLDLTRNGISKLNPSAFRGLTSLVSLELRLNNIREVGSRTFWKVGSSLEYLGLSLNQLMYFQGYALKNLTNIKKIDFSNNFHYMLKLDDFEYTGDSLTYLDLMSSNIDEIPNGAFSKLHLLKDLNLSGNRLSGIPEDAFQTMANSLETLNLDWNYIEYISPETLRPLNKLTTLIIRLNQISKITKMYGKALQVLALNKNRIKNIEADAFSELDSLKELYLDNNKLFFVQQELFTPIWDTLTVLDLHGNPLHCDCEIGRLIHLLHSSESQNNSPSEKLLNKSNLTLCTTPTELQGKAVMDLKPDEFICSSPLIRNTVFELIQNPHFEIYRKRKIPYRRNLARRLV